MWGGGNEGNNPYDSAIDMMGRYSTELDGTRAFHRQEGWGGVRMTIPSIGAMALWTRL